MNDYLMRYYYISKPGVMPKDAGIFECTVAAPSLERAVEMLVERSSLTPTQDVYMVDFWCVQSGQVEWETLNPNRLKEFIKGCRDRYEASIN